MISNFYFKLKEKHPALNNIRLFLQLPSRQSLSNKFKLVLVLGFLQIVLLSAVPKIFATHYHISVNGKATGNGSQTDPWDLATGISGKKGQPGDTIWLHGGVYKGQFVSRLKGSANANIVLAQYPGEVAIIDGYTNTMNGLDNLTINGSYATYYGFTVLSSEPKRTSEVSGSRPTDINSNTGIQVQGSNVKLINLIVRNNVGVGIGFWKGAKDSELYGNIIYNNGWQGPDRGHGHGIYTQNEEGIKHIKENIIFGGYGRGIQIYGVNGGLKGYNIENNVIFNSGSLAKSASWNIIVGGETSADNITIKNNHTYKQFSSSGVNVQFHYSKVLNGTLTVSNNYFVGGDPVVSVKSWERVTLTDNTLYGKSKMMDFNAEESHLKSYVYNNNTYLTSNNTNPMAGLSFDNWKTSFKLDKDSKLENRELLNEVILKSNRYEKGHGTLIIYNHEGKDNVTVDLSRFMTSGAEFKIWDVENLSGEPILKGTYDGKTLDIPMDLKVADKPIGHAEAKHSDERFGVFIIKTKGSLVTSTSASVPQLESPKLYPNPVQNRASIRLASKGFKKMDIEVKNMEGRVIKTFTASLQDGENEIEFETSDLRKGVYVVTDSFGTFKLKMIK